MEESPGITRKRIDRAVRRLLERAVFPAAVPLALEVRDLASEPVPYAEAVAGRFEPYEPGRLWGSLWGTSWFRARATVPAAWAGEVVALRLDLGFTDAPGGSGGFGAEGLVYRAGVPFHGISGTQKEAFLPGRAAGGEEVVLEVEAAMNPNVAGGRLPGHDGRWDGPDHGGDPWLAVGRAELAVVDLAVRGVLRDVQLAVDLCDHLPAGGPRHAALQREVLGCLDRLQLAVDAGGTVGEAVRSGEGEALRAQLARPSAQAHRVLASGHAHIDTAWLWPIRETRRKVARTVATALAIMDERPEYRFSMSSARHWAWLQEDQPALFERAVAAVRRGQLAPAGALWVEPDCNLPSGESMARQALYGTLWFREHLGLEVDGAFVPDVFGYPGSMPGIFAAAGLSWFCTQKLSWNRVNRMPHHSFWWEGIDGSRVFAHFPPTDTYNAELGVDQLDRHLHGFADHATASTSLALYGYGDGGGGPTRALLERIERVGSVDPLPQVETATVGSFFEQAVDEARAGGDAVPVWVGELYFEMHRGTLTTHADAKAGNRRLEQLLREAELWWAARCAADGEWGAYPGQVLRDAWQDVLTLQFHDILPGTSIGWVYADLRAEHARLVELATGLRDAALAGPPVGGPVVVNPTARARTEEVDGHWVSVPPLSVVPLVEAEAAAVGPAPRGLDDPESGPPPVLVRGGTASNGLLRVTWDATTGLLSSVHDLRADRPVLTGPGNVLQLFADHPVEYDAWDIDADALAHPVDWTAADLVEPTSDGFRVRRTSPSGRSTVSQRVRLRPGSRRIDVETEVDWHEDHLLLKAAFPLAVRSARATYEVQWGAVERPTHVNTSWDAARFEVCGHRWADLSEHGYGVALLNDGKHGYDCNGSLLRLSLLRAPTAPDPDADRGRHAFTYSLLPHAGGWQEAGVVEEAEDLNRPLRLVRSGLGTVAPVAWCSAPGVVVEAVKRAEDGSGLVVRCYESRGGRARGRLEVAARSVTTAQPVDLCERAVGAPLDVVRAPGGRVGIPLELRPFGIASWLLR